MASGSLLESVFTVAYLEDSLQRRLFFLLLADSQHHQRLAFHYRKGNSSFDERRWDIFHLGDLSIFTVRGIHRAGSLWQMNLRKSVYVCMDIMDRTMHRF